MAEREVIHLALRTQLDVLRKALARFTLEPAYEASHSWPLKRTYPTSICRNRLRPLGAIAQNECAAIRAARGSPPGVTRGRQYPGIRGKVVDFADHAFEEGTLYIRVRFTDTTELCWRITSSILIEEADLCDWKSGDSRQICVFVEAESSRE